MKTLKNISLAALIATVLFLSQIAKADNSVKLTAVKPEQIDRCLTVSPQALPVKVGEVNWDSPDRSVGVTSTKAGSEPVTLSEKLEDVLTASFNNFFQKCGFKAPVAGAPAIVIDLNVQDFFVKAKNDIVVGKTEGVTRITISYNHSRDGTYTVSTFGVEKEYKTGPSKKLKRLEKILNEILLDTMNDIASQRSFYDTIDLLSKP